MEQEKIIYICETKNCQFLFESKQELERCPDCGKTKICFANAYEIAEYEQRKKEFNIWKK